MGSQSQTWLNGFSLSLLALSVSFQMVEILSHSLLFWLGLPSSFSLFFISIFPACSILFYLLSPSLCFSPLPHFHLCSLVSLSLLLSCPVTLSLDLSISPTISLFFVFQFQLLYTGKVSEDVPPEHFILKVSATDLDSDTNAQITYSLHGPGADEFKLDPHTGRFPELQDQAKNWYTE